VSFDLAKDLFTVFFFMRVTPVYAVRRTLLTGHALHHERYGLPFLSVRDVKFQRSGLLN